MCVCLLTARIPHAQFNFEKTTVDLVARSWRNSLISLRFRGLREASYLPTFKSSMYTLTKSRTEWKFSISCQPFFALFFPIDLVSLFWWIRCWCCLACACFGATGASTVFRKQSFCCYCWCCCCCVCEWVFFFSRSLTRSIPFSSLCRGSGCLFYARLVPLVFLCM